MFDFYGKRKIYYIISAVLILAGIVGLFVNGVKLDITFSGGAKLTYSYTGAEINATEVESLVKSTLNRDATVQNATGYQTDDIIDQLVCEYYQTYDRILSRLDT